MRFPEYVEREGRGVLQRIARSSGVSYQTIFHAKNGHPIKLYDVAKSISDAIDGEVTVEELCEQELA